MVLRDVLLDRNVRTAIRPLMALITLLSSMEFTVNRLTTNSDRKTATMVLNADELPCMKRRFVL